MPLTLQHDLTVRTSPTTVVVFSILWAPFVLAGLTCLSPSSSQPLTGLALCACYPVAVWIACSSSVTLRPEIIVHRSLFAERYINLETVAQVYVTALPAAKLTLVDQEGKGLTFRIKPFSRTGVAAILAHVAAAVPNAAFNETAIDLARGDFDSVTRESIHSWMVFRVAFGFGIAILIGEVLRAVFDHVH